MEAVGSENWREYLYCAWNDLTPGFGKQRVTKRRSKTRHGWMLSGERRMEWHVVGEDVFGKQAD